MNYANSLRCLAAWYDAHPEMPEPTTNLAIYSLDTKEEAAMAARALGTFHKSFSEWNLTLNKEFGQITLAVVFSRAGVCTRKVVGVKTIPAEYVEAHVNPARTEEIVEWECGSIMRSDHEPA